MADNNLFMQEVAVLKQAVQEAGRIRNYSEEEFDELINTKLAEREQWAASSDPVIYRYYQSLSFKEKAMLKYTINESVEGLGILGKLLQIRILPRS